METKHTAGNWKVKEVNFAFSHNHGLPPYLITNEFDIEIASVTDEFLKGNEIESSEQQTEANARLIAAAPKLLEALIKVTEQLTVFSDMDVSNKNTMNLAIKEANEAINQATK